MTSSRKAGSDSEGALRLYERDTDLNPRTFLTWTGLVIQVTLVQWCQFGTWCDRCTVQSNDLCGPFEPSARPYRRRCQPVYHTLSYLLCFPGAPIFHPIQSFPDLIFYHIVLQNISGLRHPWRDTEKLCRNISEAVTCTPDLQSRSWLSSVWSPLLVLTAQPI